MQKESFEEYLARNVNLILFTVTLLCAILFWWGAQTASASTAPPPSGAEQMAAQQEVLLQREELQAEVEQLQADLDAVEKKLKKANKATKAAKAETENVLAQQVMMTDSVGFTYVGDFYLTAYCCEAYPHICGGNGVTASGTAPTPERTIAADWGVLPAGTWVFIEGVGLRRVEDTGGAIKGQKIDVAIDTHANALAWGGQGYHRVWVLGFDYA